MNLSGGWRRLERLAQAHPRCFVAVEARYSDLSQTPTELIYVVAAAGAITWERFSNR